MRKADIAIRSGETARLKMVHLSGDSTAIIACLARWIGTAGAARP
jgi:uncharacterized protein YggU (UPF0235/DUF167 family)